MARQPSRRVDRLYAAKLQEVHAFRFDRSVAEVFDDMIARSVPFYHELQAMMVELAQRFVQPSSAVYDLGCATGTTLRLLSQAILDPTVKFHGLDGSADMIRQAKRKVPGSRDQRITMAVQDLHVPFQLREPSVVVMAWTLQFLRPPERRLLLARIHDSLLTGGCLILIEKVLGTDAAISELMNDVYCDFKRRNRYSDLEIAQKRDALEDVLIPCRLEDNIRLLRTIGFSPIEIFFKWFNFAGVIAVKPPSDEPASTGFAST